MSERAVHQGRPFSLERAGSGKLQRLGWYPDAFVSKTGDSGWEYSHSAENAQVGFVGYRLGRQRREVF
jgi:hypothetical protein